MRNTLYIVSDKERCLYRLCEKLPKLIRRGICPTAGYLYEKILNAPVERCIIDEHEWIKGARLTMDELAKVYGVNRRQANWKEQVKKNVIDDLEILMSLFVEISIEGTKKESGGLLITGAMQHNDAIYVSRSEMFTL